MDEGLVVRFGNGLTLCDAVEIEGLLLLSRTEFLLRSTESDFILCNFVNSNFSCDKKIFLES